MATVAEPTNAPLGEIRTTPSRSATASSWTALGALVLRDLAVLRKHLVEFVIRVLVQPFLLCFVFLFVFRRSARASEGHPPRGGVRLRHRARPRRGRHLDHVPGHPGGGDAPRPGVRLHPRDRGPSPSALSHLARRTLQGALGRGAGALVGHHRAAIASVVHAPGVHANIDLHWWVILTLLPIACVAMSSLGLLLGCSFEPRNIGLMFGFIVLPITFLGGTYYQWTRLAPVTVGSFPWLQALVLVNPLIYVNEGMRAAFTNAEHMHLYIVYPVLLAFGVAFLSLGLHRFRSRVLS